MKSGFSEEILQGTNLFTIYEQQADFDEGYDYESFRAAIAAGKSGLTLMTVGGQHVYLYYVPIQGTDWYMITSMAYETVNDQLIPEMKQIPLYSRQKKLWKMWEIRFLRLIRQAYRQI